MELQYIHQRGLHTFPLFSKKKSGPKTEHDVDLLSHLDRNA